MVCCLHVVHFFNYTLLFETGSAKYQPQVSHLISSGEEESGAKVAAMKPVKQTVTYDSSTGKMYEELGSTGSGSGESHVVTIPSSRHHVTLPGGVAAAGRAGSYFHNYQPSYSGVSSVYGSGMQTPAQYMASSYSSPSYVGPYDR